MDFLTCQFSTSTPVVGADILSILEMTKLNNREARYFAQVRSYQRRRNFSQVCLTPGSTISLAYMFEAIITGVWSRQPVSEDQNVTEGFPEDYVLKNGQEVTKLLRTM